MDAYSGYGDEIEDVPDYFGEVLQRIQSLFNSDIEIYGYDDEWLNFGVSKRGDRNAIMALDANTTRIFPGNDRNMYQILCPLSAQDNSGLWLHYMGDVSTRQEYRSGCWFY